MPRGMGLIQFGTVGDRVRTSPSNGRATVTGGNSQYGSGQYGSGQYGSGQYGNSRYFASNSQTYTGTANFRYRW
jgi:hypothetical protein